MWVNKERKDLEKFIKFLALKSSQIIVQSRLGDRIKTQCNPHTSGNDWFNIAITDQPDVLAETKKALQIGQTESVVKNLPLCVEISLQTVEGDKMILEVWSLSLNKDHINPDHCRPLHTTYNRMGLLLKSLISITRVTPAYKLSRRQSPDSYHIYYRVYTGNPQTHNLGDGRKHVRVGQLATQIGTLNMAVVYRTKMTISPTQQPSHDNAIMVKSDHFVKDISPKHIRYNYKKNEKNGIDLDKPLRCGAFVDVRCIKQYTEEDFILPETPPFSWLLRKPRDDSHENNAPDFEKPPVNSPTDENSSSNANNNNTEGKSVDSSTGGTDPMNFRLSQSPKGNENSNGTSPPGLNNEFRRSSRWSAKTLPPEDERLLKELHFPFATSHSPIGDLAKFYRECFNAPPLQEFNQLVASEDEPKEVVEEGEEDNNIDDLTKQLEQFETSLGDYDTLVTSLCESVDSNLNS